MRQSYHFWWINLLFLCCQLALSQEPAARLSLDCHGLPLSQILQQIEQQSGCRFSYESTLLDPQQKQDFQANASLENCLHRLLTPQQIGWKRSGTYIILKRQPRRYTVSGFVRDSASYESLLSASVMDRRSGEGTVTNNYGFYSITLPADTVRLSTSYVGYHPKEITLVLTRDTTLDLPLTAYGRLQEVVVEAGNPRSPMNHTQLGMWVLTPKEIRQTPTLLGEPDLIKTLQRTPGVANGTEAMVTLSVRGGGTDENLIWLDGTPLYQVGHLGGLFSTFNPDAVKLAGFYKGSFPAHYGERLSSVVDVRSNEGDKQHYHGSATLGLIAGKLNLSGPLVRERTSFNLAVRRTWLDALLAPTLAILRKTLDDFDTNFRYAFQDVNLNLSHRLSERGRLEGGFYYGDDMLRLHEKSNAGTPTPRNYNWRWGNIASSLNWHQAFNPQLFSNLTLFYTRYRSHIDNRKTRYDQSLQSRKEQSHIEDLGARLLLEAHPHPSHRLQGGSEYIFHRYHPGQAHEYALFGEDSWSPIRLLQARIGLRLSGYRTTDAHYLDLSPRLSVRYRPLKHLTLKASYAEMNQYIHTVSDTYLELPSDRWLPTSDRLRPMSSRIVSAGLYSDRWAGYLCSLEGYYKTMNHLAEYRDDRYLLSPGTPLDKQLTEGSGRSYGIELMLRKTTGRLTGWAGYTLSWSDRLFPELNEGRRFPDRYDNRHKLNLVATFRLNDRVELNAAWTYASGNHLTFPTEAFQHANTPMQPLNNIYYYFGPWEGSRITGRNNVQLPAYHRLDLGLTIRRPLKRKGHVGIWNIGIYNAYCRMNPIALRLYWNVKGNSTGPWIPGIESYALLPLIPSVSYTYQF